jgi:hypothetical protein
MVVTGPEAVVTDGPSVADAFRGLYTDPSGRKRPEADPSRSRLVSRMRAGGAVAQIVGALFGGNAGGTIAAAGGGFAHGAGQLAESDAERLRLDQAGYDEFLQNATNQNRAVGLAEAGATLDVEREDRAAARADAHYLRDRRDDVADRTDTRVYDAGVRAEGQAREDAEALTERMGEQLGDLAQRGGTVENMAPLVARVLSLPGTPEGQARAREIAASYRADYERGVANERSQEARGWRSLALQEAGAAETRRHNRVTEARPVGGGRRASSTYRGPSLDEVRQIAVMDASADYGPNSPATRAVREAFRQKYGVSYDDYVSGQSGQPASNPAGAGSGPLRPHSPTALDNPLGTAHGATDEDVADAEEAYELGLIGPAAYTEITGRPAPRR